MTSWYNEIDPYAAQWLRNLIDAKLIAPGDVDTRSITEVTAADLDGYTQCHFFAGIGGWSHALRLAGWPDDRAVWTGSCPCQPFSVAGKRKGFADDRHLWPVWRRLIEEYRPAAILGEQVARASEWLALVRRDLEALDYAVECLPVEAASVGAPHLRDRYWIVAHASGAELRHPPGRRGRQNGTGAAVTGNHGAPMSLADTGSTRLQASWSQPSGTDGRQAGRSAAAGGWWCSEPDVGRVAHGVPARVGRLRAYGNAIVPQVAAEFIKAAF